MDNYDYVYMSDLSANQEDTADRLLKRVRQLEEKLYAVETERDRLRYELEGLKAQGPCRS